MFWRTLDPHPIPTISNKPNLLHGVGRLPHSRPAPAQAYESLFLRFGPKKPPIPSRNFWTENYLKTICEMHVSLMEDFFVDESMDKNVGAAVKKAALKAMKKKPLP